jgi:hypothetical protein
MPISEEGPDTILKTIGEIPSAVKYGSGIETSAFSCGGTSILVGATLREA